MWVLGKSICRKGRQFLLELSHPLLELVDVVLHGRTGATRAGEQQDEHKQRYRGRKYCPHPLQGHHPLAVILYRERLASPGYRPPWSPRRGRREHHVIQCEGMGEGR